MMGSLLTEVIAQTQSQPKDNIFVEELEVETIDLKSKDPMVIFKSWLDEAKRQPDLNILPETMTFCTVKPDGGPTARSLLLRGLDDEGFKMYWDKRSPKTSELNLDARGALIFVWHIRDTDGIQGLRQARIEGTIEELPEPEVNAYFSGEPLMAKIRAVVCHQSRVVHDDRAALQSEMDRVWREVQMDGVTLSRPHSFQGYLLRPNMIEFYKGKKNSINDRIRFKKTTSDGCNEEDGVFPGENGWFYERLEP